ncbi:TetR family transcriptional regulator [Paraburkholderia sp. Ac-20342]|uniref:TetR/AcrR family transcriptional regulator n=1 Tax=Paraburkholderia sp. Ac-20342 TaxID=2703889 RepID=UPI001981FF1D|nr:TetR/AcrR family transcriptional regulator [Paraburkholderia sp. Ac-20342]MBN3848831.1 TetR family transcriptional regulator [Paraburkholderia sp. Ac-20342]
MPRNSDDARKHLIQAALDLFAQNGFEQTTAAQIAARAGVTERTFFRLFVDKREVLFYGQSMLSAALAEAVADAPALLSPMEVLRQALEAVVPLLEGNRRYSEPRQRIIAATPALQEREAAKRVALTRTLSEALEKRGISPGRTSLASHLALGALSHALAAWFAEPDTSLKIHLDRAFAEMKALTSVR